MNLRLNSIEINGFKSFAKKTSLEFHNSIVAVVGPNGSGKSNVVEALRFVLGEQSMKSMRGKAGSDLIFKGSKNLPKNSRASVVINFNNQDKIFKLTNEDGENINLNFDQVSIGREVYADGINKYLLNNSEVRLKDINNLLASVNIGSSGHHIISQGEADRILNASPKDRKEMIEDALGLKIYQYKIREASRKLDKTTENMKEVSLLRRENAPHLNFLKKQVEKFEKAKEMKIILLNLYQEYLKKESVFLENEKNTLDLEKNKILKNIEEIKNKISFLPEDVLVFDIKKQEELNILERKISEIRSIKNEMGRKLGRIEGMIEIEENRKIQPKENTDFSISKDEVESFLREANEYLEEATYMDVLENIIPLLHRIKDILDRFALNFKEEISGQKDFSSNSLEEFRKIQKEILSEIAEIEKEEENSLNSLASLRKEIEEIKESNIEKERESFILKSQQQELFSSLEVLNIKENNLIRQKELFENELREGNVLIGPDILSYKNFIIEDGVDAFSQEERKRKIERIKIKLEDAGLGGGSEVLKEYQEVLDRDNFLAKEIEDLSQSMEALKKLMSELKEKIDKEFQEGIKKINKEFADFFALMFGGGTGYLDIVFEEKRKRNEEENEEEEEKEIEPGIEINVSLPHKKVKELQALSGGERSLTSIALLFAMSQVNPPPFLVLDETDAALDEANSRKFGDMLEKLSKHSQLIVVTHNRETMSRAGALYGVTVGNEGSSRLLSVKFDEATAIAK